MTDLRISCSEKYKKQIKKVAVERGIPVSQMLFEIVTKAIPEDGNFIDYDEVRAELDVIRNKLIYQSNTMSYEEKENLKIRKDELKAILKKEAK